MSRRLRQNILLALFSLLLTLAALNCALPLFVPISDFVYFTSREGYGLIYEPNQRGSLADALGHTVPFRINGQGFNAPQEYTEQPDIAVIGDSFVAALQVAPGEAFPDLLDAQLAARGCPGTLTYRFGMGGAPLSHYVGLMRQIGQDYHPQVYVVNLIGNDYVESLKGHEPWGPYYYLLQESGGDFVLLDPEPFVPDDTGRALDRALPLRRYLNYNLDLVTRLRVARYGEDAMPTESVSADPVLLHRAVRWMILALQAEADRQSTVLILMAGAHFVPYADDIEYLDLARTVPAGDARYLAPDGGHWNERGHAAVAEALAEYIGDNACPGGR